MVFVGKVSEMSATNNVFDTAIVISDEDDDDTREYVPSATTTPAMVTTSSVTASSSSPLKPAGPRPIETRVYSDDTNISYEESDGRRISRRRKNRNTEHNDGRSNGSGTDHTNDNNKANASTSYVKEEKKFTPTENRETRSRKRDRSPTPPLPPTQADVKESETLAYKEILSGLEGAAFQSRFVECLQSSNGYSRLKKKKSFKINFISGYHSKN